MEPFKNILLAPGPVKVLPEILEAQAQEMFTHRSKEFSALYTDLVERLKKYYQSEEAYVITGSGALGIECLIANLCLPNEKMICFPNGEFGEKFIETAKVYTNVVEHRIDDGRGWNFERAKKHIDEANAQVLGMVYNETSYGVRNDVKDICKYAKSKGMLVIIDGVSAWPGTPFNFKEFAVDGFVTGSQKGIGAPPGMAMIGLSKEAVERYSEREKIPSYYLNLKRHQKIYQKDGQTPNTPAISLFWALQKAFDVMDRNGGLQGAVKRHMELSAHIRERLIELGFGLIAEKGFESYTVTGFYADSPEKAKNIKDRLAKEYKIKIVGSRGKFKDNGLRIANMSNVTKEELDKCLDAIEKIMK
ncbi:MAG: alanine--glyoxylate aminotransferase family protein [Candidatus Micrarchaeota archaeon]|nr:alanine--glyoxylate aminotransferase family protein [Candidatus Micrarchaeota archaeon]